MPASHQAKCRRLFSTIFCFKAANGYFVVVFVYVMEFIGKKSRIWASMHLHTFFAIGVLLVALASYLVQTWWLYQLILCTVTVPFILCCWMLLEIPFRLLSGGRYKEAQGIVDTMAAWNESCSCDLVELLSLDANSSHDKNRREVRKHSLADLFHNSDTSKRTLTVWLVWFAVNFGYYTFTMEAIRKKEHEYLYIFLVGALETPPYFFLSIWLERLGRRSTMVFFLFLALLACAAYLALPQFSGLPGMFRHSPIPAGAGWEAARFPPWPEARKGKPRAVGKPQGAARDVSHVGS